MGSPLGPSLANAFLCFYEVQWLNNCPNDIKPVFYRRYVDDIFCLFEDSRKCERFLNYMNSCHRSINFTLETENNNTLSFLDCLVTRSENEFGTSVYRKSSFSGVYTHFLSFLPSIYKTNIIMGLIHRCYKLCSSMGNFHLEIQKLKEIFQKNGYPRSLFDMCIKKYLNKLYRKKTLSATPEEKTNNLVLVLPFLGIISIRLKKKLQKLFQPFKSDINLKIVFRSSCKVSSFLRFKDRIPSHLKSHLLYHFKCSCCNATYIGETMRHYDVRVCEHLRLSEFTGKPKLSVLPTSVWQHMTEHHHNNGKDSFSMLSCHSPTLSEYKLMVMESLLVARDNPSINKSKRSVPLYLF